MSKPIIVLGCYRSGTSAVAGVLHHLGIHMGFDFQEPNDINPKGFFEDKEFVKANMALYDASLTQKKALSDFRSISNYSQIFYKRRNIKNWGLKDPRFTIVGTDVASTFPQLKKHKVISVYRDPLDNAKSLIKALGLFAKETDYQKWINFVNTYQVSVGNYLYVNQDQLNRAEHLALRFDEIKKDPVNFVEQIANFVEFPPTPEAYDFLKKD